jgi:hypothetical protein
VEVVKDLEAVEVGGLTAGLLASLEPAGRPGYVVVSTRRTREVGAWVACA